MTIDGLTSCLNTSKRCLRIYLPHSNIKADKQNVKVDNGSNNVNWEAAPLFKSDNALANPAPITH